MHRYAIALVLLACSASAVLAADQLVVTDRRAQNGTASVDWRLRAGVVPIAKGTGSDPATIAATLEVSTAGVRGGVDAPSGAFDGTTGWTENSATRARYRSRAGSVQRSGILVSKAITLGGGSLGDPLLDALGAGVPSGIVYAAYT